MHLSALLLKDCRHCLSVYSIGYIVDPVSCTAVQWTHIRRNIPAIHMATLVNLIQPMLPCLGTAPGTAQSCDGTSTGSENYEQWGSHHESDLLPTCWEPSTACNRGVRVLAVGCFQSCCLCNVQPEFLHFVQPILNGIMFRRGFPSIEFGWPGWSQNLLMFFYYRGWFVHVIYHNGSQK